MIVFQLCGKFSGIENMRYDCELLDLANLGQRGARVYSWDRAWVSLGKNQRPETALIENCEVPWVMRPTGGKAVLHGHDVTIGLAVPLQDLASIKTATFDAKSVVSVYRVLAPIIARTITLCGVPCGLGEEGKQLPKIDVPSEDCFMLTSANDIIELETLRKVCGCALRLTDSAVLVQASIPTQKPLVAVETVYRNPAPVYYVGITSDNFLENFHTELEIAFGK